MDQDVAILKKTLKQNNSSITTARLAVFYALQKSQSVTIQELTHLVPNIDRASVYRVVQLFEQLHIINRIQIGWKYKLELSDMFKEHHHHAICSSCDSIITIIHTDQLERYLHTIGESINFAVHKHLIELHGTCKKCRKT